MVILYADCTDHLCCLSFLGLLFALILGLGLVLGVALVSTTNCLLLGRDQRCLVLERKYFHVALNVESDLGIAGVDDSSGSVQEWSS